MQMLPSACAEAVIVNVTCSTSRIAYPGHTEGRIERADLGASISTTYAYEILL